MKKRILSVCILGLLVSMLFALASCGFFNNDDEEAEEVQPQIEEKLQFEKSDNGKYYIVKGIGTYKGAVVDIPKTYNDKPVKEIADNAFLNCSSIVRVNIPAGVELIGASAFKGCSSLKNIVIPNSVEQIGASAFESCSSAEFLIFGNGVDELGDNSFLGCDKIETVYFVGDKYDLKFLMDTSNSALSYKDSYYYSMTYPKAAGHFWYYSESNEPLIWYDYIGNEGLTFAISDDKTYYKVTGNNNFTDTEILIPKAHGGLPVAEIGAEAFYNKPLEKITLPDTIVKISDSAFFGCRSLVSLNMPDSIKSIGKSAFTGCENLLTVEFSNNLEEIGDNAFLGCLKLEVVSLPDSLKTVGNDAFYACVGLTSVELGESVLNIGARAFRECIELLRVVIPKSVKTIGHKAFDADIYYMGSSDEWNNIVIEEGADSLQEKIYFYSSTTPENNGYFWYYDDSGNITKW